MTVAGYYYLVVSLVIIVLGAAVIARVTKVSLRVWRLIALIVGGVFAVLILMAAALYIVLYIVMRNVSMSL